MNKIYYDKETGYLCNRYPKDIEKTDESPFIEVDDKDCEETFTCPYGLFWAVRDGVLKLVDDVETQATEEYKTMVLNNEITELQKYLTDTDYIITKLNEAKLEDDTEFEAMKAQYSEQLTKRKEARSKINELQKQLEEINR